MSTRPIIVFDSGIGGLSIYRPLRLKLPTENVVYITDSQNFPYGNKSPAWLRTRFRELGKQFLVLNPKLVVLACNTATVAVISELRTLLSCPIVGVEPIIKPLAVYHRPLALMTSSAAHSKRTKDLIKKHGSHVELYTPCGLVEAIEYNDITQVKKILLSLNKLVQKNKYDAIGLSCTHYSLFLEEFKKTIPNVIFLDPAGAVVKEVLRML
ncbi:MAG: aspartate/glutamate racemase family protein [bacterium]